MSENAREALRWHLGDWVLQSDLRGQCLTSSVVLTSFPVAGKAASLYPALVWPLCRSDSYRLIDSGSVQYCVLSWVLTTHKPSSLFWVLLFVLRKGLFLRPGWPGLCVDQAGLKLRAICPSAFPVLGLQICTTTSGLFFVLRTLQTQFLSKKSHWMFEESWLDLNFLHSISLVWASPKVLLYLWISHTNVVL